MRVLFAALAFFALTAPSFGSDHTPSLLLTPKLLRRLQRDRTRQTPRWQSFEARVQNVPDSPERGFELALYYAVTHDADRGRQAVAWALAHKDDARQAALVLDWADDLLTPVQRDQLKAAKPKNTRDRLFLAVAGDSFDASQFTDANQRLVATLQTSQGFDPATLYPSVEYLMAYRAAARVDLRESNAAYFGRVPKLFLLSLTPNQIERPDWHAHIAALALVTLDPNLESSQFLQGWAMEDSQTLHDGPGVAYELLWADPYLPGIAYENMDPWEYDPSGLLFARTNWDANACWIQITPAGMAQKNCDQAKFSQPGQFGTLTLARFAGKCADVPARKNRETLVYWKLPPRGVLNYEVDHQRTRSPIDPAGIWLVPNATSGRACLVN